MSRLHTLHFTDRRASDRVLAVPDRNKVLCDTDVGDWVKRRSHCGGYGMYVWHCVWFNVDFPIVRYYEEVQYEKDLLALARVLMSRRYPNLVGRLFSRAVHLITCILMSMSVTGRVIATLSFVFIVTSWKYLLAGMT